MRTPLFSKQMPKQFFSQMQGPSSGPGFGAMLGVGVGTAGLLYLMYYARQMTAHRNMGMQQQLNYFHPEVQARISRSLGYFGGGLALTGCMVGAFRNSALAYANPWLILGLSLGTMFGTILTNYQTQPVLKHAFWLSFMGTMGLSMVPLINMASMPIIYDALFATGFTMAGLGLVAYNAPSEQFLKWGGALGMCCAGMIGLSLVQMFWPSPALFNIWLYGGLVLFSAFTLYDVQKLIHAAKTKNQWDPISESLGLYLDAIILFERFLIIFMGNSKKK